MADRWMKGFGLFLMVAGFLVPCSEASSLNVKESKNTLFEGTAGGAYNGTAKRAVAVYGEQAFAVLDSGRPSFVPLMAAAPWGSGRVLVAADRECMDLEKSGTDAKNTRFYSNVLRWLANGDADQSRIVTDSAKNAKWLQEQGYANAVYAAKWQNTFSDADILWVKLPPKLSDHHLEELKAFVKSGAGLAVSLTVNIGSGPDLERYNGCLSEAGLGFAPEAPRLFSLNPKKIKLQPAIDTGHACLFPDMVANSAAYSEDQQNAVRTALFCSSLAIPPESPVYSQIKKALPFENLKAGLEQPSVMGREQKHYVIWENLIVNRLPLEKIYNHPLSLQVGENCKRISKTVSVDLRGSGHRHVSDTGLYAAPGEMITVRIPSKWAGKGIRVGINHVRTRLSFKGVDKEEFGFCHMPFSAQDTELLTEETTFGTVHGGLVYFVLGGKAEEPLRLEAELSNVIEAPHFKLDETTPEQWENIKQRQTPWGLIQTDSVIIISPSHKLRECEHIEATARLYADMLNHETDFYLPNYPYRYRMYYDYHRSDGASYWPISRSIFKLPDLLDHNVRRINGDGLILHEFGHNLIPVLGRWKGFNESYNNWAGVYIGTELMDFAYKVFAPELRILTYENVNKNTPDFMDSPDRKYMIGKMSLLTTLGQYWGWEEIQTFHHQLATLPKEEYATADEVIKRDLWLTNMGKIKGFDYSPFLEAWHWTFSDGAKKKVAGLPKWNLIETIPLNASVVQGAEVIFNNPLKSAYSYDGVKKVSRIVEPKHGRVEQLPNGDLRYRPAAGYVGIDQIGYVLENGLGNRFEQVIHITVIPAKASPKLLSGTVDVSASGWKTVTLPETYRSMIVVAQPVLNENIPVVTRVRNAAGNRFDVKLQHIDGSSVAGAVFFMVVEEGVYGLKEHGIRMEAFKVETENDAGERWKGKPYVFRNTGDNYFRYPSVFGQVMTDNNADWSTFWVARSHADLTHPPRTDFGIVVGRHSGRNIAVQPRTETVGCIAFDQGTWQIGDRRFMVNKLDKAGEKAVSIPLSAVIEADCIIAQSGGIRPPENGYWNSIDAAAATRNELFSFLAEDAETGAKPHKAVGGAFIVFGN